MRWARPVCRVAALLLSTEMLGAHGGAPGLALLGGAREGEAAVLAFGPDAAVSLRVAGGAAATLELGRGGSQSQAALAAAAARLPRTELAGELAAASLAVAGAGQWSLWDLDTFDSPASGAWSLNDRGFCSSPSDQFLGGHCRLAAGRTSRSYRSLPVHSRVRVRARVHFIDDWQGEMVALQLDGRTVWAQAHEWCPGFQKWMCTKFGVDTCGRDTPDRLSVKAEVTIVHSATSLDVAFASSLPAGTDACRSSWGVDDVSVELL